MTWWDLGLALLILGTWVLVTLLAWVLLELRNDRDR